MFYNKNSVLYESDLTWSWLRVKVSHVQHFHLIPSAQKQTHSALLCFWRFSTWSWFVWSNCPYDKKVKRHWKTHTGLFQRHLTSLYTNRNLSLPPNTSVLLSQQSSMCRQIFTRLDFSHCVSLLTRPDVQQLSSCPQSNSLVLHRR